MAVPSLWRTVCYLYLLFLRSVVGGGEGAKTEEHEGTSEEENEEV